MLLTIRDLGPGDIRHLYCSDPRLKQELARIRRSHAPQPRPRPTWLYVRPDAPVTIERPKPAA